MWLMIELFLVVFEGLTWAADLAAFMLVTLLVLFGAFFGCFAFLGCVAAFLGCFAAFLGSVAFLADFSFLGFASFFNFLTLFGFS